MSHKKVKKEIEILDKNKTFESVKNFTGEIVGNRTLINLKTLKREYKLAQAYANIRNLDFKSEKAVKLQKFEDYVLLRKDFLKLFFKPKEMPRPEYPPDEDYRNRKTSTHYPKGILLIIIDEAIYDQILNNLDQYVLDVGRDGYWAIKYTINGGTPTSIRNFIKNVNPVGALLIGAIPAPWYELDGDHFPCDLYYMDLDGTWNDIDSDGLFDNHSGNVDPEIWVSRLWTPTANGNDANMINNFLIRNHSFRLGLLGHARSAMAYVDDDWTSFDDCEFDELFPSSSITVYTNPAITDADLYKSEVNSLRSWVQLCAHSWVTGHSFEVDPTNEYIGSSYFRETNPPNAHFYNLFCCGPGRYTTADYLAGWYIFDKVGGGKNLGLTAIASAKSGSMLFFADFYRPMGNGKIIGDAFVDWWIDRGPIHEDWERNWFYGLVLLGDPTLTWWKGAVPQLEQPQKEDVFDHYPRKVQLRWDPVNLPGVRYNVEIDAFGAINSGQWAEETNQTFAMYYNILRNTFDHNFVGMQRGRWRVRAKVGKKLCSWSPWSYFKFTI
ncbi:MAG: hypothetical protein ACTSP9_08485 [Promethearchaeota archaeon]